MDEQYERAVGGSRKGNRRRRGVACFNIDAQVVARFIPHNRRARFYSVDGVGDRRQRLVVDVDPFGPWAFGNC